ncbi:hypothetical protein GCM10010428_63110 [Actinosynnema pretiosum subsp. pretiosum]
MITDVGNTEFAQSYQIQARCSLRRSAGGALLSATLMGADCIRPEALGRPSSANLL